MFHTIKAELLSEQAYKFYKESNIIHILFVYFKKKICKCMEPTLK